MSAALTRTAAHLIQDIRGFRSILQPWSYSSELLLRAAVASSPTTGRTTCSIRPGLADTGVTSGYFPAQELLIKRDYQAQKMRVEQSKLYRHSSMWALGRFA